MVVTFWRSDRTFETLKKGTASSLFLVVTDNECVVKNFMVITLWRSYEVSSVVGDFLRLAPAFLLDGAAGTGCGHVRLKEISTVGRIPITHSPFSNTSYR
ncbi:jg14270 [Pararge aegeria aegeria]|uniref:Jg14270 protein n=1 Tax=Pararge aegeria aegeria TaxID=348720 RepID=A0A8S4QII5_9NEOP|nr:jg14270 [Pararge aegeria aegeria]